MPHDVDLRVAAVAAAQHGIFATADATAAGADSSLISRRVRAGRWERLAPGLYCLAGTPQTWERSVSAAVRRLPQPAAASHRTAAFLHGLYGRPRQIEVVTVATGMRSLPFVMHQCLDLVEAEIVTIDGIAVTDIPRTITDVGIPAGIAVAQQVLDGAARKDPSILTAVAARIHRYGRKGRRGIGPARQLVVERLHWDTITDSVLEDAFLRLVDRSGLPRPTPQRRKILRRGNWVVRVDFDFDGWLVVELDSEKYHTDRDSFQYDRHRQNALVQEGAMVLRFTWWDVMAAPDYVIATLARALAQAS